MFNFLDLFRCAALSSKRVEFSGVLKGVSLAQGFILYAALFLKYFFENFPIPPSYRINGELSHRTAVGYVATHMPLLVASALVVIF